jgi:uncharacterized protein
VRQPRGGGPPTVGLMFNPTLAGLLGPAATTGAGPIGHCAVIPDRCWLDHGPGAAERFELLGAPLQAIEEAIAGTPVVLHGIGLSICSADVFDRAYIDQLARFCERWQCAWVSEHLSFSRFGGEHEANAAMALGPPYDHELLDLLLPRLAEMRRVLGVPVLVENNVRYLDYGDDELDEPAFLNALVAGSGCSLLLDLHNLYTNVRNHGLDGEDFLDRLDKQAVLEVHVAGGEDMLGLHADSHIGPVHAGVWPLLERLLPQAPQLRAITYEFHDSSWPLLRLDGVRAQLAQARALVQRNWPVATPAPAHVAV